MKKVILFIFIFGIQWLRAQESGTGSPMNSLGLGNLKSTGSVTLSTMGGLQSPVGFIDVINLNNPATYNLLSKPSFDVGLENSILSINDNGTISNSSNANFKNVILGLPIPKSKFGLAFGLIPYTNYNFDFTETKNISGIGNVDNMYKGKGGINKMTLGGSYRLLQDSVNYLSVGLNLSYLFGGLNDEIRIETGDEFNAYNIRIINKQFVSSYDSDLGLFYSKKIKKGMVLTGALSVTIPKSFTVDYNSISETYVGTVNAEFIKDTIELVALEYELDRPMSVNLGFALILDTVHFFGFEYATQNWTNSNNTFSGVFSKYNRYSFGFQTILGESTGKLFQNWRIRLGFKYIDDYVDLSNSAENSEYGISFGVGIPFGISGSLNLGGEFGKRTISTTNYSENFSNVLLGITFSPGKFDRWFVRPKIE